MMPESVAPLLPLADLWGVSDDVERSRLVAAAPLDELASMVAAVDAVPDEDLYGWLAGDAATSKHPSSDYLAITCLTMAADEARLRLARE